MDYRLRNNVNAIIKLRTKLAIVTVVAIAISLPDFFTSQQIDTSIEILAPAT